MEKYIEDGHVHDGHRGRMRAKLASHGHRIFDTYEILEMLLYQVVPYRDTNPVAKNLLRAFGSLDGVLSASVSELSGVCGIGEKTAEYLSDVGRISEILGAELQGGVSEFADYEKVGKYLVDYFSGVKGNQVVALFLDSSMRLIRTTKMYDLEYESGGVKARPFIDEAMATHASVVITAHNHPFGPFYPSEGDKATQTVITDALSLAGLVHAEHYIISGRDFAGIGSLDHFAAKLKQMPAVSEFIDTRERYESKPNGVESVKTNESLSGGRDYRNHSFLAKLISYSTEQGDRLAGLLLDRYGSIENIFTAPLRELELMVGQQKIALYLKLLAYTCSRRVTDEFAFGKQHNLAEIADYLKGLFIGESVEKIYLITFDKSNNVTDCILLGEGTVNASEVMPRKAVEAAISARAVSVAIAHNHPLGVPEPSSDDIKMTSLFDTLFNNCEIALKEHFIVAGQLCDTVIS